MLCEMCASIGRVRVSDNRRAAVPLPREGLRLECDACGGALGASVGGRVAETLAQLARFGLLGQNRLFRRRA